jgi:hypothetical protein
MKVNNIEKKTQIKVNSLAGRKHPSSLPVIRWVRVAQSFVFYLVICSSLCAFVLVIVVYVLLFDGV